MSKPINKNRDGIFYGNTDFSLPSHMNYGAFVFSALLNKKDSTIFVNGLTGEKTSLTELRQQIVNVSSSLTRLGVQRGDVVAICSENRPEFMITFLAALCSGAVVTFLNSAYSKDEMIHTMGISKPKYVFLSPSTFKTYFHIMKQNKIVEKVFVFGDGNDNDTSFKKLSSKYVDINGFKPFDFQGIVETAIILYSSGTTGLPKGAKLTHANLIVAGMQPPLTERKLSYLNIAPWSNTVGLLCTIKEVIKANLVVYMPKFNEKEYLRSIEQHKVGFLLVVPPLLVVLTKSAILQNYDVSSVEIIHCGGAPLDNNVIDVAKQRFPNLRLVIQGYGMTETCGALTEENEKQNKQGSVGTVVDGNIIKIVDVETREILGPYKAGEVCVKGPSLFAGYVGKDVTDVLDDQGFYKTGDIAYYDDEGYFFITDRLKELIKYKAFQVAPSEIEGIILQHPAVKDVGVVGAFDEIAGELPTAFVVKKPRVKLTEKEIIDFVASKVSHWKQLRGGVRFVEEIPKTPSGKILRRTLKELLTKKPKSKL